MCADVARRVEMRTLVVHRMAQRRPALAVSAGCRVRALVFSWPRSLMCEPDWPPKLAGVVPRPLSPFPVVVVPLEISPLLPGVAAFGVVPLVAPTSDAFCVLRLPPICPVPFAFALPEAPT
jgi:hypothetical protein